MINPIRTLCNMFVWVVEFYLYDQSNDQWKSLHFIFDRSVVDGRYENLETLLKFVKGKYGISFMHDNDRPYRANHIDEILEVS